MARSKLALLVRKCLHQRTTPGEFEKLLSYAVARWRYESHEVASSLLSAAVGFCVGDDPLVSTYLQAIISFQHASVQDCLSAFVGHWQAYMRGNASENVAHTKLLAQLITDMAILSANIPAETSDMRASIILSSRWLQTLFRLTSNNEIVHDNQQTILLVNALGLFLLTALNTGSGNEALQQVSSLKDDQLNVAIRQVNQGSMTTFPDLSMRLLASTQKYPVLDESPVGETSSTHADKVAAITFENNIVIPSIEAYRQATCVLLLHLLSQGSTIDDAALYSYLNIRHSNDTASMFNDILYASFEVLTKIPQDYDALFIVQYRFYLLNKLPIVLSMIANGFESLPTDQYLQDLWNDLQTSSQADTLSNASSFLHICTHHHLVVAETVQSLVGIEASSNVAKGLFPKQALVDQVKANASRGPRLVEELTKNDGNAGAFVQAIVELMHGYCQVRETNHLSDMASAMVKAPTTINAIALFVRPAYFLSSFCQLLDAWSWDEIHGESQPIYEEFGNILLLLMAFKFRLGLRNDEMGLVTADGFVAQYLSSGQAEKMLGQLTESEKTNLGDWIHNLYDSEGISDEVTSNCSAKEFYIMVPTLLRQSMVALAKSKLSQDKLEAGLDYLLEPFLLPSLLSSFAWLSQAVFKDYKNSMILLRRLVRSPENLETNKLHRTILSIARAMFSKIAAHLADESRKEIMTLFEGYERFSIAKRLSSSELDFPIEEGGLAGNFQRSLSNLATNAGDHPYQPSFLVAFTQIKGAESVVSSMVSLLVQYASDHQFSTLLDIASTIIAVTNLAGISLRIALQLVHAKLGGYLKSDNSLFAQALIHLSRRVETYAVALAAQTNMTAPMLDNVEDMDLADINLDQMPTDPEVEQTMIQLPSTEPIAADSIDQMLQDATDMDQIDEFQYNEYGRDDDYDLTNIDDLDMSMFDSKD